MPFDSSADDIFIRACRDDVDYFDRLVMEVQARRTNCPPPDLAALRHMATSFADSTQAHVVPTDMTVTPVDAAGVPAWWFTPALVTHAAPLIYFHGGGFVCGSVAGERGLAAKMAQTFKAPLLAVGYRQAPEHPFPAAWDDAWAAYAWLAGQSSYAVTFIGDSAGGRLAIDTAIRASRESVGRPRGAIATSAWFDLSMPGATWRTNCAKDIVSFEMGLFFRRMCLRDGDLACCPAIASASDMARSPPLLVQMGSHEMALDDASAFVSSARAAGASVRYEIFTGMPHNFVKFASGISDLAIERMKLWQECLPPEGD